MSEEDEPLRLTVRDQSGRPCEPSIEYRFSKARVTFQGSLPPGFNGPVAGHLQGIFRPVVLELEPGNYSIDVGGEIVPAGERLSRRSLVQPFALCIGAFVCVWLRNPTTEFQPFVVRLLGHQGETNAPEDQELCHGMQMGLEAPRFRSE